jgi:predicted AlkP superfamily pyrophosphatase or phosphodiesterase
VILVVVVGVTVLAGCIGAAALMYTRIMGARADPQPTPPAPGKPYRPLILISSDGFRWDYMPRIPVPNIQYLVDHGVRPTSMRASFPTKTFPNHYSIVTGLYPAHHGIIDNTIYDPGVLCCLFYLLIFLLLTSETDDCSV